MPGRHRWVEHGGALVPPRTAKRWREIEAEFGEPIRDLLVGLRADGYTWSTIAGVLDLGKGGHNRIVRWRKLLGIYEGKTNPVKYPPEAMPCDRKAQALGYKDAADAITHLRVDLGMTYGEIAEALGVALSTVYRYGGQARRLMPIVPKERQRVRQLWRTHKERPPASHVWRQM